MAADASLREERPVWRRKLAWLPLFFAIFLVAVSSLNRLKREVLFQFPQPVDRLPAWDEPADAAHTAATWMAPALIFLGIGAVALISAARVGPVDFARGLIEKIRGVLARDPLLSAFFGLACLLDLASTWSCFQQYSLADELHPAIKLVTYAYGITVGLALAKGLQAGLVLAVAALLPRAARTLLFVTTAGYSAAALWNYCSL